MWTKRGQNVDTIFGTRASAPVGSFSGMVAKRCHTLLKVGAPWGAILRIFLFFVESGKQRLDCACAVGLGFGPLVFILWASMDALCFFNVFLTSFGVPPGPQKARSAVEPAPS